MTVEELESFFSRSMEAILSDPAAEERCAGLLDALESGTCRAAGRGADGVWRARPWVKTGILAAFRTSRLESYPSWPGGAVDKHLFAPRTMTESEGVRVVPGGSSVRRGARLCQGAVLVPPCFVNAGAFVGEGSMVDSHALVGSCAQIGARVHLSAGVQIGGVLEPAGARPVVVEDGCFLGALSGLFEGVVVRRAAVLAPGVIITAATTIYDLANERELIGEVPECAVVVPGARRARGAFAVERGVSLYAPCIVKYRDPSTDAATALEEALR